jgi:hypothetical protein
VPHERDAAVVANNVIHEIKRVEEHFSHEIDAAVGIVAGRRGWWSECKTSCGAG